MRGGVSVKKMVLVFKSTNYSATNTQCACVTGGGGCQCDDGTSE